MLDGSDGSDADGEFYMPLPGAPPDPDQLLRQAFRLEAERMRMRQPSVHLPLPHVGGGTNAAPPDPARGRYTPAQLKSRFGLKEADAPSKLLRYINIFISCATDKGIPALRAGVYDGWQSDSTMQRARKDMLKFLGYLCNICGWEVKTLTLSVYSNSQLFANYLGFLSKRQVRTGELIVQVQLAARINKFLSNLLAQKAGAPFDTHDNVHRRAANHMLSLVKELRSRQRREQGADVRCACVCVCACLRDVSGC
jgi:hypothetical protein